MQEDTVHNAYIAVVSNNLEFEEDFYSPRRHKEHRGRMKKVFFVSFVSLWLIKDFSWIQNIIRIKRALDLLEQRIACVSELLLEKGFFSEAHAVLAGDGAAKRQRIFEDFLHRGLDAVHLVGVAFVGEKSRVQIAVAEVAEGRDVEPVLHRGLPDEADHLREF